MSAVSWCTRGKRTLSPHTKATSKTIFFPHSPQATAICQSSSILHTRAPRHPDIPCAPLSPDLPHSFRRAEPRRSSSSKITRLTFSASCSSPLLHQAHRLPQTPRTPHTGSHGLGNPGPIAPNHTTRSQNRPCLLTGTTGPVFGAQRAREKWERGKLVAVFCLYILPNRYFSENLCPQDLRSRKVDLLNLSARTRTPRTPRTPRKAHTAPRDNHKSHELCL